MSLSKSIKKDNVKNFANRESDLNYDSKHSFYRFYKEHNEFEEMSLDSKYNKMKEFTNLFTIFKNLKPRNPKTQLKKKRIMKNVDQLYEKYYNDYKNDFDNNDGLDEGKNKKFDKKQFELLDKTDKNLTLDEETKKFFRRLKIEKKLLIKRNSGNILATNLLHQ